MNTLTRNPPPKSCNNAFEKQLKRLWMVRKDQLSDIKNPKEAAIAQSFKKLIHGNGAQCYFELLMHLHQEKCKKLLNNSRYLRALACICYFREDFINEIHTWKRPSLFVEKQFPSLLRHLLVKYEIPLFFDSVWLANSFKHQQWYVAVAQGENIRKCYGLPFEMSKKMSYYFMTAPARYDIYKALKWSRLMIPANGDAHLIEQIIACNFSGSTRMQKESWDKTIQFFAHNDRVPTNKLRGVFDFLVTVYRENPQFSYKGRTVASLVRQSDEWHRNIVLESNNQVVLSPVDWKKSDIEEDVFFVEVKSKTVKVEVVELMNSLELQKEGRKMRHCVGTYYNVCKKRQSAIFSLRIGAESIATIEVRLKNRLVVQARGNHNKAISSLAKKVLKKWTIKNDLEIASLL